MADGWGCAVKKMIGICRVSGSVLLFSQISKPSIPGSIRSRRTRSGLFLIFYHSQAEDPSAQPHPTNAPFQLGEIQHVPLAIFLAIGPFLLHQWSGVLKRFKPKDRSSKFKIEGARWIHYPLMVLLFY